MQLFHRTSFHCLLLIVAPLILFWSGLNGPFILDDSANLAPLANYGGVVDIPSALFFIGTNESGPLGRPLSMASFLINDHSWPSSAWPFKYTNLMIHILNGLLIYWFVLLLFSNKRFGVEARSLQIMAFALALYWLLQPMQVSTVLYVVQRMTMLATTMVLLALVVYLKYRNNALSIKGQCVLLLSLGVLGGIGVLFKEVAVLLVVYIGVVELALFSDNCKPAKVRQEGLGWRPFQLVIAITTAILFVLIVYKGLSSGSWEHRNFNLWERLCTQSVIMWQYIMQLTLPRASSFGLFYDDYPIYSQVWIFIGSWAALGVVFWACTRLFSKAWAVLILGWFIGGHILESTVLPLELYFEHRNYLPLLAVGFVFVAVWVHYVNSRRFLKFFVPLYAVLLLFVSWSNVSVWSDEKLMRELWAKESPGSIRAQQNLVGKMANEGRIFDADVILKRSMAANPDDHFLHFQRLTFSCAMNRKVDVDGLLLTLSKGKKANGVHRAIELLDELIVTGRCLPLDLDDFERILLAITRHPGYQSKRTASAVYRRLAVNQLRRGEIDAAFNYLHMAMSANPGDVSLYLMGSYWKGKLGKTADVKKYILDACENISLNPFKSPMQKKLINREAVRHKIWSENEGFCSNSS